MNGSMTHSKRVPCRHLDSSGI